MPARFILVLLTWLCGCSTTATLSLVNGGKVEAKILGSEEDNLIVQTATGMEVPIARSEISEIDHPGNVAAVFGGLMTVNGTVGIMRLVPTCHKGSKAGSEVNCVMAFVPATIGVSVLAWGLMTWLGSTHAAEPGSKAPRFDEVPDPPPSSAFEFSPLPRGG